MFNLRIGKPRSSHIHQKQILNLEKCKTMLCVFPTVLFCLSCVVCRYGSTDPECLYLSRDHLEHVGLWLPAHHASNTAATAFLCLLSASTQTGCRVTPPPPHPQAQHNKPQQTNSNKEAERQMSLNATWQTRQAVIHLQQLWEGWGESPQGGEARMIYK